MSEEAIAFMRTHNINLLLLPAHTSHLIQPLDVSVFAAYKAGYRCSKSDTSLKDLVIPGISAATQSRCIMLGRALIAFNTSVTTARIRRGFDKTGIYLCSFDAFIFHAKVVRNVPLEVAARAKRSVEDELRAFHQAILSKRRIDIVDQPLIVDTDA
jgi:hypothetical protein